LVYREATRQLVEIRRQIVSRTQTTRNRCSKYGGRCTQAGGAELNRGTKPTKILGFRRSSTDADGPPRLVPAEEQSYRRRCEKSAAKSTQNSTIIAARSHRPNIAGQAAPRCPGPLTKRRRRLSFRRPISAESYYHSAAATTTIFRRRRPRRTPCRSADDRAPGSRRIKARLEKITELQNRKRTAPRG